MQGKSMFGSRIKRLSLSPSWLSKMDSSDRIATCFLRSETPSSTRPSHSRTSSLRFHSGRQGETEAARRRTSLTTGQWNIGLTMEKSQRSSTSSDSKASWRLTLNYCLSRVPIASQKRMREKFDSNWALSSKRLSISLWLKSRLLIPTLKSYSGNYAGKWAEKWTTSSIALSTSEGPSTNKHSEKSRNIS